MAPPDATSDDQPATTENGTTVTKSTAFENIASRRKIPQVELQLTNVTYAPMTATASSGGKSSKNRKVILSNVTTSVSPSKLVAWIGPSGSGKTSLISVAAGLTAPGDIVDDSVISVNGEEGRIPKRLVGVVWQDDLLLSNLTVEETIYFAARLKTPSSVTNAEIREIVDEVMEDLSLTHVRESLIGSTISGMRGISGGERKRVSVASELVVRPALLFLDEPTSGLDATTAQALVKTLKDLAAKGHSVAVVIHQPRTTIFNMFDDLLLLSKGKMVFNGPACKARAHLEACPSIDPLPAETGIADWMMDTISEDEIREGGPKLPQYWLDADKSKLNDCVADSGSNLHRRPSLLELKKIPKFETSTWLQFKLLLSRTVKQQRGERLTRVSALLTFAYAFFTSLFWWQIPNDTNGVYERNSLLFFILIAQANQVVIGSVQIFSKERALLRRERAKKMYRISPFFIAKTISDLSNNVLFPVMYGIIVYWTSGLRPTAENFFGFLLAHYLALSTAQSMGLFLSVAIPNPQFALILAPAITLFFMILGGFYIPLSNIHAGIRWATWLSFARYGYSAQIVNEYAGRSVPCATEDVAISIGSSDECPVPGEEIIYGLGIDGISSSYWFNIGMILVLQVFFRFASYALLRRSK